MSEKPYTFDSSRYKREVPPPASIEVGSSPPHFKIGVYIDFDNLYGTFLDLLNIPSSKRANLAQKLIFPKILSSFLRGFQRSSVRYVKAFAEFENLPHSNSIFDGRLPIFLHNNGVIPHSPFIISGSSSKKKNKNAADISLVLKLVEDIVIKEVPVDRIIIVSGDGDFFPLIQWVRENTTLEINIAFFEERLNSIYFKLMSLRSQWRGFSRGSIIFLNQMFKVSIYKTVEWIFSNFPGIVQEIVKDREAIEWFRNFLKKYGDNHSGKELLKMLEKEIIKKSELRVDEELKRKEECNKFIDKVIDSLNNWLRSNEHATTGLIITSWFPKWKLDMDEEEANNCLKYLITEKMPQLEEHGIIFELKEEKEGKIEGTFYKIRSMEDERDFEVF